MVEFPAAPLAVGDEFITNVAQIRVANKNLPILSVADVIKDRLSAYLHWHDRQSLIQAVAIMRKHQQLPENFRTFLIREEGDADFLLLSILYQRADLENANSMEDLERILVALLLST